MSIETLRDQIRQAVANQIEQTIQESVRIRTEKHDPVLESKKSDDSEDDEEDDSEDDDDSDDGDDDDEEDDDSDEDDLSESKLSESLHVVAVSSGNSEHIELESIRELSKLAITGKYTEFHVTDAAGSDTSYTVKNGKIHKM